MRRRRLLLVTAALFAGCTDGPADREPYGVDEPIVGSESESDVDRSDGLLEPSPPTDVERIECPTSDPLPTEPTLEAVAAYVVELEGSSFERDVPPLKEEDDVERTVEVVDAVEADGRFVVDVQSTWETSVFEIDLNVTPVLPSDDDSWSENRSSDSSTSTNEADSTDESTENADSFDDSTSNSGSSGSENDSPEIVLGVERLARYVYLGGRLFRREVSSSYDDGESVSFETGRWVEFAC